MLLRKIMRACHLFNFQYQIYWSIFLFFLPLAQLIFFLRITRVIVKVQVAHTGNGSSFLRVTWRIFTVKCGKFFLHENIRQSTFSRSFALKFQDFMLARFSD